MQRPDELILGEFSRALDERFRISLPTELIGPLLVQQSHAILAKERRGCLSLWNAGYWQAKLDEGVNLLRAKVHSGRLDTRLGETQLLGRLLSTRHQHVTLGDRGRLVIPEGFRSFLGVEAGGEAVVVGAAVCLEIWNPNAWLKYLSRRMPRFRRIFDELSG